MHYAGIHLSLSLVTTKIDDVSFIFIIIEIFFSIYAFNGRTHFFRKERKITHTIAPASRTNGVTYRGNDVELFVFHPHFNA